MPTGGGPPPAMPTGGEVHVPPGGIVQSAHAWREVARAVTALPFDPAHLSALFLQAVLQARGAPVCASTEESSQDFHYAKAGLLAYCMVFFPQQAATVQPACAPTMEEVLNAADACTQHMSDAAHRGEEWAVSPFLLLIQNGLKVFEAYSFIMVYLAEHAGVGGFGLPALDPAANAGGKPKPSDGTGDPEPSAAIGKPKPSDGTGDPEPPAAIGKLQPSDATARLEQLALVASAEHALQRYLRALKKLNGTVYMKTRNGKPLCVAYINTENYFFKHRGNPALLQQYMEEQHIYLRRARSSTTNGESFPELYCKCAHGDRQGGSVHHRRRDCTNAKCEHNVFKRVCRQCSPQKFCAQGHRRGQCPPYCQSKRVG